MRRAVLCLGLLILAGCSKPQPPAGRWEGGYDTGGTIIAARVEIGADGLVKVSAPDVTNLEGVKPEQMEQARAGLAADLAGAWDGVAPRKFDYDGKTFRKPGGIAPQMIWDKDTKQMTLEFYLGTNPALPVPLRPVDNFHDNPWPAG